MVGEGRCPVVDTWWQTETGGILLVGLPGAVDQKPGKAGLPFFGVQPEIVDAAGNVLEGEAEGLLLLKDSWPGQMRTVYGDHARFEQTYFSQYADRYFTGDGCRRDADGYYQITGRVDDVINVSGHRLGTAEIESALVLHPAVAEAAVVGFPHDIKGQGIHAYVTLVEGHAPSDALREALRVQVRQVIGPLAQPGPAPVCPGPAQNALGQDHAAHPAQDRRGRHVQPRRHHHPRRPRRCGRPRGQPGALARCSGREQLDRGAVCL